MAGETYTVIRSNENEHSVWPTDTPVPDGFDEVGVTGSLEHCESWVRQVDGDRIAAASQDAPDAPEEDDPR